MRSALINQLNDMEKNYIEVMDRPPGVGIKETERAFEVVSQWMIRYAYDAIDAQSGGPPSVSDVVALINNTGSLEDGHNPFQELICQLIPFLAKLLKVDPNEFDDDDDDSEESED